MFGSDALDQLYELKGTDLCSSLQKGEVQPKPVVISRIAIDARLPFPTSASLAHVIADFLCQAFDGWAVSRFENSVLAQGKAMIG